MRVAIVRQHYDPEGEIERVVERAIEALLERNVAISLITRRWPPTRLQLIEPVICDPAHAGGFWGDWGFARAACGVVRRTRPTLVEAHEPLACCDLYRACDGVIAARLDAHLEDAAAAGRLAAALSPRNRYRLHAERRMFANPWLRAVICRSPMVRDEIRGRFGLPDSKLHVVYDPVDGAVFHPGLRGDRAAVLESLGIAPEATVYLAVAPDFARAGIGTAIDALAVVPAPAHLIVVGDDAEIGRYRARAQARGVAERVAFAGAQHDVRPWYGAADAFVAPAAYDPAPVSALEAMACGLPVVAGTKSGVAEMLREHDAGRVFSSRGAAALAAHLHALQDPATRARLSENARRAVAALSPEAITLQHVLLYRELLSAVAPTQPGPGEPVRDRTARGGSAA